MGRSLYSLVAVPDSVTHLSRETLAIAGSIAQEVGRIVDDNVNPEVGVPNLDDLLLELEKQLPKLHNESIVPLPGVTPETLTAAVTAVVDFLSREIPDVNPTAAVTEAAETATAFLVELQGMVDPLLQQVRALAESIDVYARIEDADWLGLATNFVTQDPKYACLRDQQLNVWAVPGLGGDGLIFQTDTTQCEVAVWVTNDVWPVASQANTGIDDAENSESGDDGTAPQIDIYLRTPYGDFPCTREVMPNDTHKYVCRRLGYTTNTIHKESDWIKHSTYVDWGEASGGNGYTLYVSDGMVGRVWEGCELRANKDWVCAATVEAMVSRSYATKGQWYANAFEKWVSGAGAAVQCTYAIYNKDAQGLAENCFAEPAE